MFTYAPAFGPLRPASLIDVPRIAIVATRGFRYSPVFQWERPYHEQYPDDTLISYRAMFAQRIKDPEYIVVVAEDTYDPDEDQKSSASIPPDDGTFKPRKGESVIAGVASWKLEPESRRVGQFQNHTSHAPDFPKGPERDKHKAHIAAFDKVCDAAEDKYFSEHSLMDMVVVHPAYWRRGHGSRLVRWGMALADMDQVKQGVLAADMGAKLYLQFGFVKICEIHADGDKEDPDGISNFVARYTPKGLKQAGVSPRSDSNKYRA